ncbi:MAG: hypothetical protein U5L06_11370 [Rhodovibrio sp.]|nr:hypothetical protein [Rhodovibrio sp.]
MPEPGDGPLTRLRSWLLGIENLQQRILIGLAVICLLPVLYAYFAYKPYRAIEVPQTPVVETDPRPDAFDEPAESASGDAARDATVADSDSPAGAAEAGEPAETLAAAGERPDASDADQPAASTQAAAVPPIRPIRGVPAGAEAQAQSRPASGPESGPNAGSDARPDPETALAQVTDWAEPLTAAAVELLENDAPPAGAGTEPTSRPEKEAESAPESEPQAVADTERDTGPSPEAAWNEVSNWAEPLAAAAMDLFEDDPLPLGPDTRGWHPEPATPGSESPPEPGPEPEPGPDEDTRRTIAAAEGAPETASPSSGPADEPPGQPTPETESLPEPESGAEPARPGDGEDAAASERALADEGRQDGSAAAGERAVAEAGARETGPAEPAQDQAAQATPTTQPDPTSRRHIEDLLAGYRRSFEKGWLEDFLDHFTETPRENRHQGRDWFRSNYGWLFENSEDRTLDIDILDIERRDDHWRVVTRFDMQVDYPDRPTMRSGREVHYRIETNEHDQFRIAAIEY